MVEKALALLDGVVTRVHLRTVIYSFTYPNNRLVEKVLALFDGVVTRVQLRTVSIPSLTQTTGW